VGARLPETTPASTVAFHSFIRRRLNWAGSRQTAALFRGKSIWRSKYNLSQPWFDAINASSGDPCKESPSWECPNEALPPHSYTANRSGICRPKRQSATRPLRRAQRRLFSLLPGASSTDDPEITQHHSGWIFLRLSQSVYDGPDLSGAIRTTEHHSHPAAFGSGHRWPFPHSGRFHREWPGDRGSIWARRSEDFRRPTFLPT